MSGKSLTPGRLEAFSDGIIAVIITIMVLELKVPSLDGAAGVRAVLPAVDEVETVSHGILWANLLFLFFLSLFPFVTEWIGVKGLTSFNTALYAAVSIFPGLGYMALWAQVRSSSSAAPHASWGKQAASVCLYLAAIPAAYYRPAASLVLIGVVAVLWLLPPRAELHPK